MPASAGVDRYTRLESFLDNIERVEDPMKLQEPFRSLWLRVHGDMPTLMSDEDMKVLISRGFSSPGLSGVEIESSDGSGIDAIKDHKGSSIEVVSPDEVGPTIEMKVEDKKVKFKAAGEDDIKSLKAKEDAAQKIVSIQKLTSTLKGIGGESAKIVEQVRNMAVSYRDGKFDDVVSIAHQIEDRMSSDELKKSIIVQLQKKISEYEEIGGDLTLAKTRFKELALSMKEGKDDFYSLAQSTNKIADDSIKDLVTIEDVELAEPIEVKKEEPKPEPVKEEKPKVVRRVVKRKPELPGEASEEPTGEEAKEEEVQEPKPVIRIVKKQVVVIKTRDDDEEEEDFSLDLDEDLDISLDDEPEVEEEITDQDSTSQVNEDVQDPQPVSEEVEQPEEESIPEQVPEPEMEVPEKNEEAPSPTPEEIPSQVEDNSQQVSEEPVEESTPEPQQETTAIPEKKTSEKPPEGPGKEDIEDAFKKYQFVYNAAVKLHSAGKDVTQIFDLYSFGEGARQKGDMKTYVGVGKQLQDMLIAMQK